MATFNPIFLKSPTGIYMAFGIIFMIVALATLEEPRFIHNAGSPVFHEFTTAAGLTFTILLYLLALFEMYHGCFDTKQFRTLMLCNGIIWTILLIASSAYLCSQYGNNLPSIWIVSAVCGFLAAIFMGVTTYSLFTDMRGIKASGTV